MCFSFILVDIFIETYEIYTFFATLDVNNKGKEELTLICTSKLIHTYTFYGKLNAFKYQIITQKRNALKDWHHLIIVILSNNLILKL
jgi:protein subunit release factor A